MKSRCLLIALLSVLFAGLPAEAQQVLFTPEAGLSGPTEGDGTLRFLFGRRRPFHVRSLGSSESDGSFTLHQTVTFKGEKGSDRTWSIRQLAPLSYEGTLSNASGRVTGHTSGRRLSLRYRVRGPIVMHQRLELMPDGKTIDNVGRVTLLGIPIGFMHEIIRPVEDAGVAP